MASSTYRQIVTNSLGKHPELRYLERFLNDNRKGNEVCQDRATLYHNAILLDRINGQWVPRSQNQDFRSWEPSEGADGQAIVLDYLDTETIEYLGLRFDIDPQFFQAHLAGCEQHYRGGWAPSHLTSAPCLRSTRRRAQFFSIDYRRPYIVRYDPKLANFEYYRTQRCSLLRSHHRIEREEVLFEHERYSIAWFPGTDERRIGAIVCICDPVINIPNRGSLLEASVAAVKALPPDQKFDGSIVCHLQVSMSKIVGLWNAVAFHLDHQISSLEDQLEGDFWDGPQKPESILHETQRASRRLRMYRGQLGSMRTDLVYHAGTAFPEDLVSDVKDIEEKLETLIQRADKAEQGLLATIAINEAVNASKLTAKASRLTAIALWFAPLSLSISLVSIDGDSKFGGKKYWIMALIAVPLLLLVMVLPVAKTSDMFMKALGKLRRPFLNARGLMTKVAGRLGKVTNPSAH